jgi:hypothetical protein
MAANKRIMKVRLIHSTANLNIVSNTGQELGDVNNNPPPGCTIKLAKEDDLNIWDGMPLADCSGSMYITH